jgi:hypothetical protein
VGYPDTPRQVFCAGLGYITPRNHLVHGKSVLRVSYNAVEQKNFEYLNAFTIFGF